MLFLNSLNLNYVYCKPVAFNKVYLVIYLVEGFHQLPVALQTSLTLGKNIFYSRSVSHCGPVNKKSATYFRDQKESALRPNYVYIV